MAFPVKKTLCIAGAPKGGIAVGISIAQWRVQLAEQTTEFAMSNVGRVVEETRRVCDVAEAAIAEVKSVHSEVESRVAILAAQAEASAVHIVDVLSKYVSEVVAQSEVQASHIIGTVSQRLEKDIEAATVVKSNI